MPSNVEIAILALLIVNLLATVYYNYQSEEDYAAKPMDKTKTAPGFGKMDIKGQNTR